jgi:uncharacterized surface protein with fasciclin (FAS1) repeats
MKRPIKFFSTLTTFLIALAIGLSSAQAQENDTVADIVTSSEKHSTFVTLLEKAELKGVLEQPGPYTVLAPTNEAFEELGEEKIKTLKENPQELQNVLVGHLFQGNVSSSDVEEAREVNVTKGDIEASNGVVHVIDEVMIE